MKFLTVREISERLNVSPASVYHLIQAKEINFYKIGWLVRIREEDIDKYLKDYKKDTLRL
jgi:excisionase family DNA binding protein